MAVRIPTFADLGLDDPRAATPLPNYPANDPVAEGVGVLGKGVQAAGAGVLAFADDQRRKQNQLNAALAEADLDGNLIRFSDAAKNERDPAKLDALKGELPGYLDRASATIADPEARQLWLARSKVKINAAESVALAQHRKIYNDSFLAGASQQLDEQARLAAQASDEGSREQAKRNIGSIIGSLASAGIIGAAKEQELMSGYGEKVIIGTVNWLDANKDPIGAGKFLRENLRHIDPGKAESLARHLRPHEDREIGRSAKERTRPGGGDFADRVIGIESSGRDDAKNPRSSAAGAGQFIDSTWLSMVRANAPEVAVGKSNAEILALRRDRTLSRRMVDAYAADNRASLAGQGLPVDDGALYLAHFLGPAGAATVLKAAPDTPVHQLFSADVISANPQLAGMTAGSLRQMTQRRMSGGAGPPDIRSWVDRIDADTNLTEEQKDIAKREVHQEQQQAMLGHAQAESDLTLGIARGEKGRADIEDLYQAQRISPAKRTQLHAAIDKIEADQNAVAQAVAKVSAAGSGGAPLDPKSKDDRTALNIHYDAVSKAWPAEEIVDRSLAYAAQYGMVPTALQARIRGGLHSGRPELAIEAVRTVNRLRNANPQLVGEIDDENLRFATLISSYDSVGVPPELALQMAVDGLKVPKAEREARADEFDSQRGKDALTRRAADTKWIGDQQNTIWVNDPDVDPLMRREFEEVAKAEFQKTGNLEASRRMALDNINRVWGRSEVGGDLRYMKFAPEKFYGAATLSEDDNAAWMREQLVTDVAKGAFVDPGNPITPERIKLLADPSATQSGLPVYQVWLAGPDGSWQQVVKPDGNPIAWKPDWAQSEEFKRRKEGRVRTIEELQKVRMGVAPSLLGTDAGRLSEDVR